jgi:hypothetical protein
MARKDIVTITGRPSPCLNLDGSVGLGAQNETGDVMLIQAFLVYVHQQTVDLNGSIPELPEVNGRYGPATSKAINDYCRGRMGGFLGYNGRIDPAKYAGRNIKNPRGKLMVITRMHLDAKLAEPRWGSSNYVDDILRFYPMLNLHLKRSAGLLDALVGLKGMPGMQRRG